MEAGVMVDIYGCYTGNFKAPFCLSGLSWTKVSQAECFLARLSDETWADGDYIMTASLCPDQFFVKR